MEIEVRVTHHIDAGDPDADGFLDFYYEYDLIRYVAGDLVLVARSYVDQPEEAHLLRLETPKGRNLRGVTRDDLPLPVVLLGVAHLRRSGKKTVRWITATGYEDVL